MSKIFEKLIPFLEKEMAFHTALNLFEWDSETLALEEAMESTAKVIEVLSEEYFHTLINPDVEKLLKKLEDEKENRLLTEIEQAIVRQLRRLYDQLQLIPPKEYKAYQALIAKSTNIWAKARENKSFQEFLPTLKEIIEYKKKFAKYRSKSNKNLYDILLEDYEPGFKTEQLDCFFEQLKEELVPFIKEIVKKADKIDKVYNTLEYEKEVQRGFCRWISGYVGFNFNRGVIAESQHPFTTNLHNHDVRMTNHFEEHNLEAAIFSAIHESGHAIYEMNITDELTQTLVGGGVSMGMHESQSRFFENIIGKSKAFWKPIYQKLIDNYPKQLRQVSLEQFIQGINKPVPGAIRIDADELTYPLHILIRYEIEKLIFEEKIKIEDLPDIWNKKYKQYLGVEPEDDAEGILQDVHWAGGDFGYFPSYAIGSAIAAQIYYHMKKIMPFEQYLEEGNITAIREYLRDHIHKYGMTKNTNELLKQMMNEEFNPKYYIKYLKEKYTNLVN